MKFAGRWQRRGSIGVAGLLLSTFFTGFGTEAAHAVPFWTSDATCNSSPAFAGGAGTSVSPWQISSAEQLQELNDCLPYNLTAGVNTTDGFGDMRVDSVNDPSDPTYVNPLPWDKSQAAINPHARKYFLLTADIDLSGKPFLPIGIVTSDFFEEASVMGTTKFLLNSFQGNFDGDSHTVSNLTVSNNTATGVGLFGIVDYYSSIKNLNIVTANIEGRAAAGGLAGISAGKISNIAVIDSTIKSQYLAGGLIGKTWDFINGNPPFASTGYYVYKLSNGESFHKKSCVTGGTVEATSNFDTTSGLTGAGYGWNEAVGGVFGFNGFSASEIFESTTVMTNKVTAGGVVGWNTGNLQNSYARGSVLSNSSNFNAVGGFAGSMDANINFTYTSSYVEGSATAASMASWVNSPYFGGHSGYVSTAANVTFTGSNPGKNYWDNTVSGFNLDPNNFGTNDLRYGSYLVHSGGGDFIALASTTSELQSGSFLSGKGFSSAIWNESAGSYPTLKAFPNGCQIGTAQVGGGGGGGSPTSYTVTFNNNNGSGTMTAQVASTSTNLTAKTFTRSGYTFSGWATTSGGSVAYADQASYAFTADATLYAKWSADSHTVTYNSKGGSAVTAGSFLTDGSISVAPTAPTKSGYTFDGWTANDGDTTTITFPYSAGVISAITLYAKWSAIGGGFTVTYDSNGATSGATPVDTATYSSGDFPVLADGIVLSRTNYTFVGWWTTSAGNWPGGMPQNMLGTYPATESITGNTTYYAQWMTSGGGGGSSFTVTFDSNGGSGTMSNQTASSSTNLTANTFTRSGYTFSGWATSSGGLVAYADQASYAFTSSVTFYALWASVPSNNNSGGGSNNNSNVPSVISPPQVVLPVDVPKVDVPPIVDTSKLPNLEPVILDAVPEVGKLVVLQNGKAVEVIIQEIKKTEGSKSSDAIEVVAKDWKLALAGVDADGNSIPLNSKGQIVVGTDNMASTSGQGFLADSTVKVFIFSTPQLLGSLRTDADGKFIGSLPLPAGINPGDHTLQVSGYSPNGEIRTASVGILIEKKSEPTTKRSLALTIRFALNSAQISPTERVRIEKFVNRVIKLADDRRIEWSITGFTQPTLRNPNPLALSKERAKSAEKSVKIFGAQGLFKVVGRGNATLNIASSRSAEIKVKF